MLGTGLQERFMGLGLIRDRMGNVTRGTGFAMSKMVMGLKNGRMERCMKGSM